MKPTLSLQAISRLLQLHGFSAARGFEVLGSGLDSQTLAFQDDTGAWIVRINRADEGFQKDAYAYAQLRSPAVPIPKVAMIGVADEHHVFCVSERLPGCTLQDCNVQTVMQTLEPTLQTWEAIRHIDISGTSGFGVFDTRGVAPFTSWQEALRAPLDRLSITATPATPDLPLLLGAVAQLIPQIPEVRALIHGDFGSSNVLTDGRAITGVIDWDCAGYGDPLLDIATAAFWSPWLDCMRIFTAYCDQQLAAMPGYRARMLCYQLWIGLREIAEAPDAQLATWIYQRCLDIFRAAGDHTDQH